MTLPGTVHLWEVDLDSFDAPAILSEEERARAARFRFERDRKRFVAGRTALRIVLANAVNKSPDALVFQYGPAGKPTLPGVSFNLTHSGARALIAVTGSAAVGIDLEEMRPIEDMMDTARAAFAPGEFNRWRSSAPANQLDLFYRIWTRKEAYLKAIGEGIAQRLHQFEVAFEPGERPRILHGAEGTWTIADVSKTPDYIAALAMEGPLTKIERHILAAG